MNGDNAKGLLTFLIASILLVCGMSWYCQFVYDGDNFYHLGHAQLYLEKGIFYRPFPWATYSVISQYNSDLWWGFHVLLIPVWLLQNKVWVLIFGTAYLAFLNVIINRTALVRLGLNQWLSFALFFGSYSFTARMETVRPQVLSSALLVLLFSAFSTNWTWVAIVASILLGLLHPTLAYMLVLVAVGSVIHRRVHSGKWSAWLELSCLVIVLTAGCIRPGITDGLQLLKVQLIDLMIAKRQGAIQNFGSELKPADQLYFLTGFLSPVLCLLGGLLFSFRARKSDKSKLPVMGSLIIVIGALLISTVITRRGIDQFVPFAILASLLLIQASGGFNKLAYALIGFHATYVLGAWAQDHWIRPERQNAEVMRGAAEWLAKNSEKGEIVGQAVWSDFAPLFFYNKHNRYFGGMDPIFQYTFDKRKYWIMAIGAPGRDLGTTSPNNPLETFDDEAPISQVYLKEMKTRFLVASSGWNKQVQDEIVKDPNTKIVFDDGKSRVYQFTLKK